MTASLVLALPLPISVNDMYANRKQGGRRKSDRYRIWANAAGWSLNSRQPKDKIAGHFIASIVIDEGRRRGDCDNRIKCVLDALQTYGVIENDSLCDKVTASWGYAPEGCRVSLYAVRARAA